MGNQYNLDGILSAEYLESTKYGKLKVKFPVPIHRGSTKKIEWICDCGRYTTAAVLDFISGLLLDESSKNCCSYIWIKCI